MTVRNPHECIAILIAAKEGNQAAQQSLLEYFDAYIIKLSLGPPGRNGVQELNEDIKVQLQLKLIASLKAFDLDGLMENNNDHRREEVQHEYSDKPF